MVAIWVLAAIFWIEGIDSEKPLYLFLAATLMAACGLYHGGLKRNISAFHWCRWRSRMQVARKRRVGMWALYLLVPIGVITVMDMPNTGRTPSMAVA